MIKDQSYLKQGTIKFVATITVIACLLALALLPSCTSSTSQNNADTSNEAAGSSSNSTQQKVNIQEGATAPDFTFTTTEGATANLSDYRGKVVLLNFWATWCGYCIQEMPAMQQIAEDYDDVVILAVNRGDTTSDAISFAQDSEYTFSWGLDEDGAIEELYPANGIPYSIIIDAEGVITTIYEGSAADMYPYFQRAVVAAGA